MQCWGIGPLLQDSHFFVWRLRPPLLGACIEKLGDLRKALFLKKLWINRTSKSGGDGPCRDGAALITQKDGRSQIIGICSEIPQEHAACGKDKNPQSYTKVLAVHTNITNYVDWINSNIENASSVEISRAWVLREKIRNGHILTLSSE